MAELDNDVIAETLAVLPEEELRVCLFTMGDDIYAIPVEYLSEIIISRNISPVPTTPSYVLGVINLRGNIVPIVDIRPALSLPPSSVPGQIAIVKHGTITLGIAVDNVSEVIGVPESTVLDIPSDHGMQQAGRSRSFFFKGIIQRELGEAALLDLERVLEEIKLK